MKYERSDLLKWATENLDLKISTFLKNEHASEFMLSNRSASISCANLMGVDLNAISFEEFPGMERRQSTLFDSPNRTIVEDYAHHPTEIRAFLAARRNSLPDHWMKVVFQSHRYSRTKAFAKSFAEELGAADERICFQPTVLLRNTMKAGMQNHWLVTCLQGYAIRLKSLQISRHYGRFLSNDQPEQLLFVGAGNVDSWGHAFAAISK